MIACATMHTGLGSLYMCPSMVLFIPTTILIMRATILSIVSVSSLKRVNIETKRIVKRILDYQKFDTELEHGP